MPLHPDSIPTSQQLRETLFDKYYYPFKREIWAGIVLGGAAILGVLGWQSWRRAQRDEQWSRYFSAMGVEAKENDAADERRVTEGRIAALTQIVSDFPNGEVAPFALASRLNTELKLNRFDEARATLGTLQSQYKDFVLNARSAPAAAGQPAMSLGERLDASIRDEQSWAKRAEYVHPAPSKDRLALIETSAGSFWIGFYPDHAPLHVENFVRLAKEGYFNGTQVFEVRRREGEPGGGFQLFSAGSLPSKVNGPSFASDPAKHDLEEGEPEIEPELSRFTIRHRKGVVTAVTTTTGESGYRFRVVTAPGGMEASLNGRSSAFGAVIEDRETSWAQCEAIAAVPTYGSVTEFKDNPNSVGMRDHPFPYVFVRRVTIWNNEKLEEGHAWDTANAGKSVPEPWESTIPEPFRPSGTKPGTEK